MMGLAEIQAVNLHAAEIAAAEDIRPLELFAYDWAGDNPRPQIPTTGYLDPDPALRLIVARYFVDTTGWWGVPGSFTLTQDMFVAAARLLHALASEHSHGGGIYWAVVEQGQFQAHVEAYVATGSWFDASAVVDDRTCWAGDGLEPLEG